MQPVRSFFHLSRGPIEKHPLPFYTAKRIADEDFFISAAYFVPCCGNGR